MLGVPAIRYMYHWAFEDKEISTSVICDFHVPHLAICFPRNIIAPMGQLLVPRETVQNFVHQYQFTHSHFNGSNGLHYRIKTGEDDKKNK